MIWYQVPGDPPGTQRIMRVVHGRYLAAYAVALVVLPGARLWELNFHAITRGERGSRLFDTEAEARKAAEGAPSPYDVRMSAALWRMMQTVLRRARLSDSVWGIHDEAITRIWALVNEHTTDEPADILDENPQFTDADADLLREYTVMALYEYWMAQPENALGHQARDTLARIRLADDAPVFKPALDPRMTTLKNLTPHPLAMLACDAFKPALDPLLTLQGAPTKPAFVGAPLNGVLLNLTDGSWIAVDQNNWRYHAGIAVRSIVIGTLQEDEL